MVFVDIFSKKKTKEQEKTTIVVDNREKNSLVASELVSLGNKIDFKQLEIADYLINNIAIERKTQTDLIQSIIDKRIFSQLENLKKYPKHLLIIEKNNSFVNLNENILKGFILSLTLKFKISLIFSQNERDTAKYLTILANKKESKSEFSSRPSKNLESNEEKIKFILEGFPNVGPKRATELLKKFKNLKNIINATEKELDGILGKNAKDFLEIINLELQF